MIIKLIFLTSRLKESSTFEQEPQQTHKSGQESVRGHLIAVNTYKDFPQGVFSLALILCRNTFQYKKSNEAEKEYVHNKAARKRMIREQCFDSR